jgi:hypothetical protein
LDYATGWEIQTQSFALGDFNADGKPDVAVAYSNFLEPRTQNQQGGVLVLLGKGDGTFQPGIETPLERAAGQLTARDFDGDGKPDLIALTWCRSVYPPLGVRMAD